jgi:DNA-binding transcriptional MerR regulator
MTTRHSDAEDLVSDGLMGSDTTPLPPVSVQVPAEGLSIGEAAAACGLSVDALRYYEREGLTRTPPQRASSGQRRYHARDLEWLAGVIMLRATGMPVRDVREFAELTRRNGTQAQVLAIFEAHRERVLEQLQRTQRHLAAIDQKIDFYRLQVGDGGRRGRSAPNRAPTGDRADASGGIGGTVAGTTREP